MATKKLLDSDSESDEDLCTDTKGKEFQINEGYAENYNRFREKEVYQKLKDKYGEDAAKKSLEEAMEDASDSESEDDDAEALTEQVEKDFFKTLAMLKTKNPKIYDKETKFYKEEASKGKGPGTSKSSSSKPLTIGDLQRKVILEKEGKFDEMSDQKLLQKSKGKTYVQEMEELKDAFRSNEEDEQEEDNLLVPRAKTSEEKAKEDADYRTWLAGQTTQMDDKEVEDQLGGLRSYWNSKGLSKDEKFLRDYILNRKYLGNEDEEEDEEENEQEKNFEEDEETMRYQEEFEIKYNFRFEEPDPEFIKRYPRTMGDTMKKKDNSRKKKREEVKAKKDEEKAKQREELKQLKALKRKEIVEKIRKLEKVTGADMAFKEEDLDDDFDPDEYDKRMAQVFEHYDEAGAGGPDDEKPEWSDMSDIDDSDMEAENWDEWEGPDKEAIDDDNNHDTDPEKGKEDPGEGTSSATKKELAQQMRQDQVKKSARKMSKFEKAVSKVKPAFDPKDKTFQEYLDEYYGLDYEDAIGDLKCRFKYRNVEASGFGLTTEEILAAPDRELNAWCSLKKTCQYRSADEERRDFEEYERKGKNAKFKQKLLPSLFKEDAEQDLEAEREKKAKRSRKRKRKNKGEGEEAVGSKGESEAVQGSKADCSSIAADPKAQLPADEEPAAKKKRKRAKKAKKGATGGAAPAGKNQSKDARPKDAVNAEIKMSDDRLKAYGLVPNQYKRKVKKSKYIKK